MSSVSKVSGLNLNRFDSVFITNVWNIADCVSSAVRRVFQMIPSQARGLVPLVSGVGVAFMDVVSSYIDLSDSLKSWSSSVKIGDGEGERRAGAQCAKSASFLSASIGFSAQNIAQLAPHVAPQAAAIATGATLGYVVYSLYGVATLVGIGLGALGIHRNRTFRSNLNVGDQAGNADQTMVETLQFLRDKILSTADESNGLRVGCHAYDVPKRIGKLEKKKFEYVKRRTSEAVANQLKQAARVGAGANSSQIDDWIGALNTLDAPDPDAPLDLAKERAREGARKLINDVKQANRNNTMMKVLGLVASIVFFVGILLISLSTGGALLPLALLGVASAINAGILWRGL
ncbi:MAG TPA: hypothetical protein VLE95_03655 [Chlamydiales bacterium]|nr:hypothetical protein [Chlamydiales bacterium]